MYLSLEAASSVCDCFPAHQYRLAFCCLLLILRLIKLGLLSDSHFATQQSQFSQLFIRLFQPLSLAVCQLRERELHSETISPNLNGTCQPPRCREVAHLSLTVHLSIFQALFCSCLSGLREIITLLHCPSE